MFKFYFLEVRYVEKFFALMYQTILKFKKTSFVFFKHNHLKYLIVSPDCISLLTVSTPKLKSG